jgi:hypothetical protein
MESSLIESTDNAVINHGLEIPGFFVLLAVTLFVIYMMKGPLKW